MAGVKKKILLLPFIRNNQLPVCGPNKADSFVLAYFINEDILFPQDPEYSWHLPTTLNFLSDLADF